LLEQQDELEPKNVNIKNEVSYYVDEEGFDDDEESTKEIEFAIEEFGVPKENIGIISSYGSDADWEDIKHELDRRQIEYYEFDTTSGETNILLNMNDL